MPRYQRNPTGVPTGLPERLSERKTWIESYAASAVEGFGPRDPGSAEFWPQPEILQRLIAKLPWGHTTRVLARVKGRHLEPVRSQSVLVGRIAARKEAAGGESSRARPR